MTFFACFVTVSVFIQSCTFLSFTEYRILLQTKYRLHNDSILFPVMALDITFYGYEQGLAIGKFYFCAMGNNHWYIQLGGKIFDYS